MRQRQLSFLAGVFTICMCSLMLQIIQTRILSVITWYHIAFFAISMAMLGMTGGSLYVYFRRETYTSESLAGQLSRACAWFALATALSVVLQISTIIFTNLDNLALTILLWLKAILILTPPYFFAGMAISLALTRGSYPVGLVYSVDLIGAASGCLVVLVLLSTIDAISAMLAVAALGALAAAFFRGGADALPVRSGLLDRPVLLAAAFAVLAAGNAALHPHGLVLTMVKEQIERPGEVEAMRWNSFSRVRASRPVMKDPMMWGPSPTMPAITIEQRYLNIDGDAATGMYRFNGDPGSIDFLRYDITNLAYGIRHEGRAAVVGVGGGRDVLSAWLFGFRDITGVELNPVFVDWLENRFSDFNGVAKLPGVRLIVDEARSWFARSQDSFDLVQMSMIDTWAATGAGAFSLSENGLYTVEGWRSFLGRLAPEGVFTVSRWYAGGSTDETGRLLSLARAALTEIGVEDPAAHLYLAAYDNLSTLIVGRSPLTPVDLAALHERTTALGFSELMVPGTPAVSPVLARIMAATSAADVDRLSAEQHLDFSPPTDNRPFFFNQLRISDPGSMIRALRAQGGVIRGNLLATLTLAVIVLLSALLVTATVVIPALPAYRHAAPGLARSGTAYFLLIGLGFMFAEIGLIQRVSVFLGHPVYGLAIGLFGIILATGLGSLLSSRRPLADERGLLVWGLALGAYLILLPFWFPLLTHGFEAASLVPRALVCLVAIVPAGLLMGYGFPTGMLLVNAVDTRPTPWFWAINGAAGVLAAGLAVAVSIEFSISTSLWLGAACYLLVLPAALALRRIGQAAQHRAAPAPA